MEFKHLKDTYGIDVSYTEDVRRYGMIFKATIHNQPRTIFVTHKECAYCELEKRVSMTFEQMIAHGPITPLEAAQEKVLFLHKFTSRSGFLDADTKLPKTISIGISDEVRKALSEPHSVPWERPNISHIEGAADVGGKVMGQFWHCDECGGNFDLGEKCDCATEPFPRAITEKSPELKQGLNSIYGARIWTEGLTTPVPIGPSNESFMEYCQKDAELAQKLYEQLASESETEDPDDSGTT